MKLSLEGRLQLLSCVNETLRKLRREDTGNHSVCNTVYISISTSPGVFHRTAGVCCLLLCMYGSHVREGSTHTALLNRVESKACCLINHRPLTDCLNYLSHWCNVASLYICYHYFHADCSSELTNCMPPPLLRPRCTRFSTSSHPYSIYLSNAGINQYLHSFIVNSGTLFLCLFFHLPMTYTLSKEC